MHRCSDPTSAAGDRRRSLLRLGVAGLFAVAGVAHLLRPAIFASIVPPGFGPPALDVLLSGIAELAGAAGLLLPATRRAARIGLIALLIAVWPANWYMALHAERFVALAPAWLLWARLPLQAALVALVVAA